LYETKYDLDSLCLEESNLTIREVLENIYKRLNNAIIEDEELIN
jgi:hypothetical protein